MRADAAAQPLRAATGAWWRGFAVGGSAAAAGLLLCFGAIASSTPRAAPPPPMKRGSALRRLGSPHLVVSHYKEDLGWLTHGWGSAYSHTVYEMDRGGAPAGGPDLSDGYVQWADAAGSRQWLANFMDENSGYLRFIIDNYENLPDVTVFLHGKPQAHNAAVGDWVRCLRDDYPQKAGSGGFVFLTRTLVRNRCIVDGSNVSVLPKWKQGPRQGEDRDYGVFADYWVRFPWHLLGLGRVPQCASFYCCGQFAASRAALRSRPLATWRQLWSHSVDYVLNEQVSKRFHGLATRSVGGIYEHTWHLLFGEPLHMEPYGARYCDYFAPRCGPCA
eukprot:TRINITY_DN31808_c0_g1_i1.p1 TRINITY_DN31808_c0_g1~~TRINITY_DN31808_c0_g1_i1.p1  ORF type:complete len:360 (+),score=76.53 TRINITY_DN31808_c0_g1_i1:89-1081(+)